MMTAAAKTAAGPAPVISNVRDRKARFLGYVNRFRNEYYGTAGGLHPMSPVSLAGRRLWTADEVAEIDVRHRERDD